MTMSEVCTRDVVIVSKDTPVVDAAKLMRDFHVGNVVVIENSDNGNIPVGILTDRDIVIELIPNIADLSSVTVDDVMSFNLITAHETDGVMETVKRMRHEGIRRIPVVDDNNTLVGIFTLDDMINLIAEQQMDLAGLINREQQQEKRLRV